MPCSSSARVSSLTPAARPPHASAADVMGRSAPSRSTAPQPQPPAPTGLSSIPKRLLIMRGLKAQAELLGSVRDDFVDKASKQRE